jgi:hypothetical protein
LRIVSILGNDSNIPVARNQTIHEISRDAAFVSIFKSQLSAWTARRKVGIELDLDLAAPLFHFFDCRKSHRHQMGRQPVAVD